MDQNILFITNASPPNGRQRTVSVLLAARSGGTHPHFGLGVGPGSSSSAPPGTGPEDLVFASPTEASGPSSEFASASKTADRSLEEVRTKSVPVSDSPDEPPCGDPPDEHRERPAPIALAGVRGRAGFPANRRSVAAPWPSPRSLMPFHRFRSRLQGLPTDARSRVSVRTSASAPSRRVQRARLERDHLTLVARKRTSSTTRSFLPRTRSFSGPLLRHLQRSTPRAPEGTPSGRGCHTTASRSALVVSHHLGGFLRAAGPGLVASRYRTWGSLRFTCARRRVYEAPAAGVWAGPTPKGGSRPDPRSDDPSKVCSSPAAAPRHRGRCPLAVVLLPSRDRSRVTRPRPDPGRPTWSTCRHARRAGRLQGVAPPTSPCT
jgi:hypothetical protein